MPFILSIPENFFAATSRWNSSTQIVAGIGIPREYYSFPYLYGCCFHFDPYLEIKCSETFEDRLLYTWLVRIGRDTNEGTVAENGIAVLRSSGSSR